MKDHLTELEADTNKLCELRLNMCKLKKSSPWDIEDLKAVLKDLVKGKSRDADGYANELFTLHVAGEDLQLALLKMLNLIKEKQQFPKAFRKCNITSIHKKKVQEQF